MNPAWAGLFLCQEQTKEGTSKKPPVRRGPQLLQISHFGLRGENTFPESQELISTRTSPGFRGPCLLLGGLNLWGVLFVL